MPDDVQVKQFELAEKDALLSFLARVYADEPSKTDPVFWSWHFLENPNMTLDNIPLWIVKQEDNVVGQMATIPARVKVGDKEKTALWIIDFILDADYRGRGLGKALMQLARDTYCPTMIALGYNAQSEAVLRSHKWVSLGSINRYHALFYPGNASKEMSNLGPVREVTNFLFGPLRPSAKKLALQGNGTIREVEEFDDSFDQLWRDASEQWPCAVVRGSRFLEWQFKRQPGKKFEVLGYYEKDRLLGYVVLFFRKAKGPLAPDKVAISDLCYSSENSATVIDNLLNGAVSLALRRRAGGLVIDILDHRVEERLRRFNFWRIKAAPPFMAGTFADQELMYERNNWYLTRADSDVSIFEHPNL
ncbi:MAG TPA: GNAT family N-acetyltransferase [Pyrinomonadaceae bacterium]|nr:GNAT family N-acetyltransferase [Pyrinomonadaceae bacterium]